MSSAGFQFDSCQQYRLDAIAAVVDLFDGQPKDVGGTRRVVQEGLTHPEI